MLRRSLLGFAALVILIVSAHAVVAQHCPECLKFHNDAEPSSQTWDPTTQTWRPALIISIPDNLRNQPLFDNSTVGDALQCGIDRWRDARSGSDMTPFTFAIWPGGGGADVVLEAADGVCGTNVYACLNNWQTINTSTPATMTIATNNFGNPNVDFDTMCGRFAHELGHVQGLGGITYCSGGDATIMRGSNSNGNGSRYSNNVEAADVAEVLRSWNLPTSADIRNNCLITNDGSLPEGDPGGGGGEEPQCGNGSCEAGENCGNCETDCGGCGGSGWCGNSTCDDGEDEWNCPTDCQGNPCTNGGQCSCEPLTLEFCNDKCGGYWVVTGCDQDTNCNCENDNDECDFYYGPCPVPEPAPNHPSVETFVAGQLGTAFGLAALVSYRRRWPEGN